MRTSLLLWSQHKLSTHSIDSIINTLIIDTRTKFSKYTKRAFRLQKTRISDARIQKKIVK